MQPIAAPRLAAALAGLALCATASADGPVLDAPESAYWHAGTASWFVTNLGGGLSLERDGYGWIARFDATGRVLDPRWVEGLDAPTGMASAGDRLYVADRGGLVEIDIPGRKVLRTIELPGAAFPNDVAAAPDGTVYVSDMGGNRIYRLPPGGEAAVWIASDVLENPNGLSVEGDTLVVATWGPMSDPTSFATRHPGTVLLIDRDSGSIRPLRPGAQIANLDGIVRVGDHWFATDWSGGRLLRIDAEGRHEVIMSGFQQLADLGYSAETRTLGLPLMGDDRLVLVHLGALEAGSR